MFDKNFNVFFSGRPWHRHPSLLRASATGLPAPVRGPGDPVLCSLVVARAQADESLEARAQVRQGALTLTGPNVSLPNINQCIVLFTVFSKKYRLKCELITQLSFFSSLQLPTEFDFNKTI